MNEKNISIVILGTMWIFVIAIVIAIFVVVSFARVKKLESVLEEERIKALALEKTKNTASVLEELYEELDEALEEVDSVLEELYEELDEALEKTKNTASVIETIKNAQFGIGTIVHRFKNNGVYYYTIKIDNDTAVISSKDLFSVDETVIVCKVENALFLIDIS